jgi:hypothetical protein
VEVVLILVPWIILVIILECVSVWIILVIIFKNGISASYIKMHAFSRNFLRPLRRRQIIQSSAGGSSARSLPLTSSALRPLSQALSHLSPKVKRVANNNFQSSRGFSNGTSSTSESQQQKKPLLILYGSETGNAAELAARFAEQAERRSFQVRDSRGLN